MIMMAVAGALIVAGVAMGSIPAALVTAGVLLAAWAVLFVVEVPDGPGAARPKPLRPPTGKGGTSR